MPTVHVANDTSHALRPEPYLSPVHVAEVIACGGLVMRNDHLGALIRWRWADGGGRIEQYERLPDGRVEHIERRPDGSIVGLEEREGPYYPKGSAIRISRDLIPEAAEEARAAWRYLGPGGFQPIPQDATRLLEEAGRRILEAPAERRPEAVLEGLYVADHLEDGDLLDAATATRHRARLERLLGYERKAPEERPSVRWELVSLAEERARQADPCPETPA